MMKAITMRFIAFCFSNSAFVGRRVVRPFLLFFVFAMLFGVVIGTYSTLYVAKNIVLMLGVDRGDKEKKERSKGDHEFANIDA